MPPPSPSAYPYTATPATSPSPSTSASASPSRRGSLDTLEQVAYGPRNEVNPRADSPSDSSVARLVRELFMRAREARRPLMQQWKRNYRALNNRDYRVGSNAWDEEPSVTNIWPVIASQVAWMTDQRPTIEVCPTSEPYSPYWDYYQQLATDMNVCLQAQFSVYALDAEVSKALWDVNTYGIGYFKTGWEAPLADGLGDAAFRRKDPFTIFPDPLAHDENDLTYIIEARTMTVADADRAWPGAAKKIGQAIFLEDTDEAPHRLDSSTNRGQPRAALGALAPSTSPAGTSTVRSPAKPTDAPVVTILEAYVRGYLLEPTDQDGVTKVHDDWRCVIVCGDAILMDECCDDMNAFGTQPYNRLVLFDAGEWYGPCMVELLTPIQRNINWLLGAINRNIYLMGNPVLVEDMRNASRNKRFTNRPGQRLEGSPQSVQWMSPPQIHPQMSVDLVKYLEGKIETISGLSAMVRGFAPGGRNAQGVLDSVQDAAFVRVRASLRELERSLRGVSSKMTATTAEFYDETRDMSLIGEDGQKMFLALRARHFYELNPDDKGKRVPLRFSLTADAGSQLPTSKQARSSEAQQLFAIHAIDVYELLKAMQWPNYSLVAQRVMQQQTEMAAQASATKGR